MRHLLRLLFPRTCHRIESEGWYAGQQYQLNRRNQDDGRKCEGCGEPATRSDCEGIPLCEACYDSLLDET